MFGFLNKIFSRSRATPEKSQAQKVARPSPLAAVEASPTVRPATPAATSAPVPARGPSIQIPLASIPAEVVESLGLADWITTVSIPLDKILPQLASGKVLVTRGELAAYLNTSVKGALSPNDTFSLPLAALLKQIDPALIARRKNQRALAQPDQIGPIFGPLSAQTQQPASMPSHAAPIKVTAPLQTSAPIPFNPVAAQPKIPASHSDFLSVNLDQLIPHMAGDVASVLKNTPGEWQIPMSALEVALKKGKAQFKWEEAREWLILKEGGQLPALPADTVVQLPLPVLLPLYMAKRGPLQNRKAEFKSPAIADPFPIRPVPVQPVAAEETSRVSPGNEAQPLPQTEKLRLEPAASMADLARECSQLPGVAGAIICTDDGLPVSSAWPGPVAPETVAAFIPQIHTKILQYTGELKLGKPSTITVLLDSVPLQVSLVGGKYLAALGKAGETLPVEGIARIAKTLGESATS